MIRAGMHARGTCTAQVDGDPPNKVIKRLLIEREQHRYNKEFSKADKWTEKLREIGVVVERARTKTYEGLWRASDGRTGPLPKLSFKTL